MQHATCPTAQLLRGARAGDLRIPWPPEKILVVDDEANARTALAEILKDEGYAVETAADGFKALPKLRDFSPDVVLTDLKMPGMDGLELIGKVREFDAGNGVVIMTAFGAVDTAVQAMQKGAADYLTKPLNANELLIVLQRTLERCTLKREARALHERLDERFHFNNIIGTSPEMQRVFKTVQQVAPSKATVLISGQSGTGKELIAAAIHQNSPRKQGPFIKLHCAALAGVCWRASYLATNAARSLVPIEGARGASSWPMAAPCSWTR